MANIATFTIETDAGTVSLSTPELGAAKMARLTDWIWEAYPQMTDDDPPVLKPKNNANVAAAIRDWMRGNWQGTKNNVIRFEKVAASTAAADAIVDDIGTLP